MTELIKPFVLTFITPENIRKVQGFLMFLKGREMLHWVEMGLSQTTFQTACVIFTHVLKL